MHTLASDLIALACRLVLLLAYATPLLILLGLDGAAQVSFVVVATWCVARLAVALRSRGVHRTDPPRGPAR